MEAKKEDLCLNPQICTSRSKYCTGLYGNKTIKIGKMFILLNIYGVSVFIKYLGITGVKAFAT